MAEAAWLNCGSNIFGDGNFHALQENRISGCNDGSYNLDSAGAQTRCVCCVNAVLLPDVTRISLTFLESPRPLT